MALSRALSSPPNPTDMESAAVSVLDVGKEIEVEAEKKGEEGETAIL